MATYTDFTQHLAQIRQQPDVRDIVEVPSIHHTDHDAFWIAIRHSGARDIVAHHDTKAYQLFPLAACPVLEGQGFYQSMTVAAQRLPSHQAA